MKIVAILFLLLTPQYLYADTEYFTITRIDSLTLVTTSGPLFFGENSQILDINGNNIKLSEIKVPVSAKGKTFMINESKYLSALTIMTSNDSGSIPD